MQAVRVDATPTDGDGHYGRYQIVSRLASGGMGEVFLAKAIGAAGFEKRVVIKRLLPHLIQHAHFVQGLVREAKLLVMLDHPNIVQVLDLGREGEDYFMAMEFVPGYNVAAIAHYCSQRRVIIPATACAFIALQVLAGLEYAHALVGPDGVRHNIVHRDVSPQNVLISREGRVKLADFGIAKVLREAEAEETTTLRGKFRYMAPEALDGGRIDNRYDLFAVGIVLFEALCRRHLFAGRGDAEILAEVRQVRVPSIERYHPHVPEPLVEVTGRALAREPAERYQTAADFARALREAIFPVSESEAGQDLRAFVEDLYERPDFPLNKPKLPDPDQIDPDVTRSVLLDSHVTAVPSARRVAAEPEDGSRRSLTVLWALMIFVAAAVAYLGYALLVRQPGTEPRDPVIIKVEHQGTQDSGAQHSAPPDAKVSLPADARGADRRVVKAPAAIPFTEQIGQRVFARAGRALRACFDKHVDKAVGEISIDVESTIRRNGRVAKVVLGPQKERGTPFGRCITGVAKRIRYPRHDRAEVTFRQPLRLKVK